MDGRARAMWFVTTETGAILLTATTEAGSKLSFLLLHPEDLRKALTRRIIRREARRQFKWD